MTTLYHLVYMSRAVENLSAGEIEDILSVARTRNKAANVTGLLLYAGDSFIQVIEGAREAVEEIFNAIAQDQRHCWVTVLVRETIAARDFPDWRMGFQRLPHTPAAFTDVFEIDEATLDAKLTTARLNVQDMILGFAQSAASRAPGRASAEIRA